MSRASVEANNEIILQSWLLRRASEIDHSHRGFLADLLRLPIARRQAAFAALSRIDDADDIEAQIAANFDVGSPVDLAGFLLAAKAPAIVEFAFGAVPMQFIGGLIRCGQTGLKERQHYARLFQFFTEPEFARQRRVVIDLGRIDSNIIRVIDALDPLLLDHRLVSQIRYVDDAKNVSAAFRLIRTASSTTDEEWGQMIGQVAADGGKIIDALRRWMERADRLPAPPFTGSDRLRPLSSAEALVEAAGRFRNCLKSKIHLVLSGRVAYYEFVGAPPAIVEIAPLNTGGWGVIGIYGVANEDISPRLVPTVAADLIKHGVVHQTVPNLPQGYGALLSIFRGWDDPFLPDIAA